MSDLPINPNILAEERTEMAAFRTTLALDRTTLAWVRTTLTMTSFGLATIGFFRTLRFQHETPETIRLHNAAIHFGIILVLIGVAATIGVTSSHLRTLRRLRDNKPLTISMWPLSILLSTPLAILALYGLWVFSTH
jgi:putative membrane protein